MRTSSQETKEIFGIHQVHGFINWVIKIDTTIILPVRIMWSNPHTKGTTEQN